MIFIFTSFNSIFIKKTVFKDNIIIMLMICKNIQAKRRKVKNRHIRIEPLIIKPSIKSILVNTLLSTSITTISSIKSTIPTTLPTTVVPTTISSVIPNVVPTTISNVIPNVIPNVVPTTISSVIPNVVPTTVSNVVSNVVSTTVPTETLTPPVNLQKLVVYDITQSNIDSLLQLQNVERRFNNLTDFTWSDSMASEALSLSKDLAKNGCNLIHYLDTARGQNLFGVFGSTISDINNAVQAWIDEKLMIGNTNVTRDQIGHYLIIVSQQLSQVGCSLVANIDQNCVVATCNYI